VDRNPSFSDSRATSRFGRRLGRQRGTPAGLLAVLVGAAMVLSACGSSAATTAPAASQAAASQAAASPASAGDKPLAARCGGSNTFTIGYAQSNFAEPYRAATDAQVVKLFAGEPKFTLTLSDGGGDSNTQSTQIRSFMTKGVDLLLSSPQASTPMTPVIKDVYDSGIPVILLDRGIDSQDYTAYVGGDNVGIGKMAGEYVATKLLPDGGDVAIVEGDQSTQPAIDRQNGFKAGVAGNPKIKVVAEQPADWRKAQAQTVTNALLTAHPSIKFIYYANDEMEAGGAIAIKALGLQAQVQTGGTDGLVSPPGDNGMEQVASGEMAFTVIYPTNAQEAFNLTKDILLNCATSVAKTTNPPTLLVDKDNVTQVTADLKQAAGN
jgi:ribose transport system substrate-binding protein